MRECTRQFEKLLSDFASRCVTAVAPELTVKSMVKLL